MNRYPVARILKAFGIRGEMRIKIYFTPPSYFEHYKTIFIKDSKFDFIECEVEKFKLQYDKFAILKLKNIDTKEEADKLKGNEIFISENLLPPKEKDEYYIYELENLDVYYKENRIGYVKDIIVYSNYSLLKIKTKDDEIFIPLNKKFIERIDLNKKVCILKDIDETIINP